MEAARRAALARVGTPQLPSADEEDWRYSPIAELHLERYRQPGPSDDSEPSAGAATLAQRVRGSAASVVRSDGRRVGLTVGAAAAAAGVTIRPWNEVEGPILDDDLSAPDLFAELNTALAPEPLVIDVPAGATVDGPIVLTDWIETDGTVSFPSVVVRVGADAEVEVVELAGSAPVDALVVGRTRLDVGPGARLRHLVVQDSGRSVWRIAHLDARVRQQATLHAGELALGGRYARTRTDCRLVGRGASAELVTAYFGREGQTLDFRTFQEHEARDTTSELFFKGAVGGSSRSIYTGMIRVHPEAAGTNAFQTNRTIKLGDNAWAESVPNLEIENHDVRCSHASTVGPVDEDQLFYLASRGIPPAAAERLLVQGFFDEAVGRLPAPAVLVDHLRERVRTELDEEVGRG